MTQTYTKGEKPTLPSDTTDLDAFAVPGDYNAVATAGDSSYVSQSATGDYAIFQFKDSMTGTSVDITWTGKTDLSPATNNVILQIWNVSGTPAWETLETYSTSTVGSNFTIQRLGLNTTNYVSGGIMTCRVYQTASAPATGWTIPANEIDIASKITYDTAYNDVDLTGVVSAGTKLVMLHVRNTSADTNYACDTRMNGSSDAYSLPALGYGLHTTLVAVLDESLIFEGYFANAALAVAVTAYSSTGGGLSAIVNASPTAYGAWTDKDVSASVAAGSTAAFLTLVSQSIARNYAVHKNGSSMDTNSVYGSMPVRPGLVISGLTSGVFEYYVDEGYNGNSIWLAAYDDQFVELADKLNVTPNADTTWTDCDCSSVVPSGAKAALCLLKYDAYESTNYPINVQASGATDNVITNVNSNGSNVMKFVKLTSGRVFQGYVGNKTMCRIYVIGYLT